MATPGRAKAPLEKPAEGKELKVEACEARSLLVGGLHMDITVQDLVQVFSKWGTVMEAKFVTDSRRAGSVCGYVTMSSSEEVERCLERKGGRRYWMDTTKFHGEKVTVERASYQ